MSVVIPNFNRGHLLAAAVASALSQEQTELEVLVCDDGSTDDSESVVNSFADPRVRWLAGSHTGGPAGPRNRGLNAASGKWVAFLDSDDTWRGGKTKAQVDRLNKTGALACATNAYRLPPVGDTPAGLLYSELPATIRLSDQLARNYVITSSLMASTTELRRVGGFPEVPVRSIFEDYALWLRLAHEEPIVTLDHPWVNYRDDAATSHRGGMTSELRCAVNTVRDFTRWRRTQDPGLRITSSEWVTIAGQLSRLLPVRQTLRAALRRGSPQRR